MPNIDENIRRAISEAQDSLNLDDSPEQSLLAEAISVFRARRRLVALLAIGAGVAFMALAAFMAVRFFGAADMKELIAYAVGFILCLLAVSLMKVWFWMEMARNALLREIKRLDVRVARLAARLEGRESA